MVCLKRGPNLQEELVRGRLAPKTGRESNRCTRKGFTSCKAGRRGCSLCPFTGPAADKKGVVTQVKIEHSGKMIQVNQRITCRDSYCLYILSCTKPGCLRQYAGQSSRPLYIRFAEHLVSIRDVNTTCPVGVHWQEPGHNQEHLVFLPVEKMRNRCRVALRQREKQLINSTGLIAAGLNIYL